ncbi:hypothetical protein OG693_39875 [Streptomyces sp. NBC_01259]|uniref:hypothetical protein n=1 Tax=Streptomyces sp. NBC_01259 TaxID=2903800 RepID=UPI003255F239
MARKPKKSQRAALHRLCLIIATAFALPVYLLVPVDGRELIGGITLATALVTYGSARWICLKAYATFYKGPATSYGRPTAPTTASK